MSEKVYCGKCKHRYHYCSEVQCKSHSKEMDTPYCRWTLYHNIDVVNKDNDCPKYEPDFWTRIFGLK